MADATIRRVYEIDAKISTDALAALKAIQQNMKDVENQAGKTKEALKNSGKDAEEGAHGFEKLNFASVGARRELLVLVHELSQGNFKQFGGSLLVLGERIDATSLIMSAAGLATISFVAVLAGLAVAVAKGAIEQEKFNNSLLLTGNYAGQTASSFNTLAKSITDNSNATIGQTKEVLSTVIASGQIGPRLIQPFTEAVLTFSRVSGEQTDKVVKDFLKMNDGVLKFADEANKQYHFLTLAQHDYIRSLEESGKSEEAQLVVLKALTDHLGGPHRANLGYVATAWEAVKKAISGAVDAVKDFGKTADVGTKIAEIQGNLTRAQQLGPAGFSNASQRLSQPSAADQQRFDKYVASQQEQLRALNDTLLRGQNSAIDKSFDAYVQEEGIKGDNIVRSIQKQIRDGNKVDEVLKEFRAAVQKQRDAGKTDAQIFGSSSQAKDEELIRKHFQTQQATQTENAVQSRLRSLGQEDAALKEQIRQYDELGKSVNQSTLAKVNFDIAQGKLTGASAQQIARLRELAQAVDTDQEQLRQRKAIETADKRIAQLKEEAEAKATNVTQTKIANELAKLETDGLVKGSAAYETRAASITKYVTAIQQQVEARKLAAQEEQTTNEVQRLDEETRLIGLNTLERQKATAVLRLQAQEAKNLRENPDSGDTIKASTAKQIDEITAAITRAYEAQRSFEAGSKEAFARFNEDVTNASKFSNEFVSGSLQQLEDAFVHLFKTGKLNLGSLFQFMKDEFLKQAAAVTVNNIFGDKGIQGFVSDGIKSLGNSLGFKFGDTAAIGQQSAKQAAEAAQQAAITTSTSNFTLMNAAVPNTTISIQSMGLAANEASFALQKIIASSGGSGLGGLFGGLGSGGATGVSTGTASGADLSLFYQANGGVIGPGGAMPLNTFSNGGIADRPSVAIFGEGRKKEAYVPLPDNRSIPVTLSGGGDGGGGKTVVNVYNNGSGDQVDQKSSRDSAGNEQIDIYITKKVRETVNKDIASGGPISRSMESQYSLNRANGAPR